MGEAIVAKIVVAIGNVSHKCVCGVIDDAACECGSGKGSSSFGGGASLTPVTT